MHRPAAVADQFYPASPSALRRMIEHLTPPTASARVSALAVVSPHAGYVYSGAVAAETFARVDIPPDAIILGPNHRGVGARLAVMARGTWDLPLGQVPINEALAARILAASPLFTADSVAHAAEHSLEVQVPFLQFHRGDLSIVPVCVGHVPYEDCQAAGLALAQAIRAHGSPTLLVASTDMTHYESRAVASRKDALAMAHIESLDPAGLYQTVRGNRISMCGVIPTTIVLAAALALGATKAERVRYTDSGEASGDPSHVVGYAGFLLR